MTDPPAVINVKERQVLSPAQAININLRATHFVKFADWFPYYQGIRAEFGYSTEKDQEAARILSELISKKKKPLETKVLQKKISRKNVIVIGAGMDLEEEQEKVVKYLKKNAKAVKIAADGATQFLLENRIRPDIVVTDLDGKPSALMDADKRGAVIVVHAHGDNIDAIKKIVPKLSKVIGTTQVMPLGNVYNFGGFTDGDRSVFLAEEFGAKRVVLVGMNLGSGIGKYSKESVKDPELKKKKMQAGKHLLEMLAKQSRSDLADTSKKPIRGFAPLVMR